MGLHTLIAANPAAYFYSYSILGPGLGHVSASGTASGKMSSCHNCSLAICLIHLFDSLVELSALIPTSASSGLDQIVQEAGPDLLSVVPQIRPAFAAVSG